MTVHRSGNVDDKQNLKRSSGLAEINFPLIFPVHPRTAKMIPAFGLELPSNVRVIDPVGYLDMLMLEKNAECILTDSGGIQKEAYLLGVRCITMRDETEWIETVDAGWNCLTGANRSKIMGCFNDFHPAGARPDIYGNGHAADKMIDILKSV